MIAADRHLNVPHLKATTGPRYVKFHRKKIGMNTSNFWSASSPRLVDIFVDLCLQYELTIDRDDELESSTSIMVEMNALVEELMRREGDHRHLLIPLHQHESTQVRLIAAEHTLALAPAEARAVLEKIRDAWEIPYSIDAGLTLVMLDKGKFVPR